MLSRVDGSGSGGSGDVFRGIFSGRPGEGWATHELAVALWCASRLTPLEKSRLVRVQLPGFRV